MVLLAGNSASTDHQPAVSAKERSPDDGAPTLSFCDFTPTYQRVPRWHEYTPKYPPKYTLRCACSAAFETDRSKIHLRWNRIECSSCTRQHDFECIEALDPPIRELSIHASSVTFMKRYPHKIFTHPC